jgi:hypothetical protein
MRRSNRYTRVGNQTQTTVHKKGKYAAKRSSEERHRRRHHCAFLMNASLRLPRAIYLHGSSGSSKSRPSVLLEGESNETRSIYQGVRPGYAVYLLQVSRHQDTEVSGVRGLEPV